MKTITTGNIILEPTHEGQAAQLFAAIDSSRPELSQFLPWVGNMQTAADLAAYLKSAAISCQQNKEASFAIMVDNVAVGRIGLHYINWANKSAAIGYWLSKAAQGRGLVINSCKALLQYGFEELQLNRIELKAATTNFKSQAVPEKLHFVKEGLLRQAEEVNGQFLDLFLYSILREEWQPDSAINK